MKRIEMTVADCASCPFRHYVRGTEPPAWRCSHDTATWHFGADIEALAGFIFDWCPLPDAAAARIGEGRTGEQEKENET